MKILLTGATGYIAKRLLPILLENNHEVVCCVRDKSRFDYKKYENLNVSVIEVDFLDNATLNHIPEDINIAFYLMHSMSSTSEKFNDLEHTVAKNFVERINKTHAKQMIYLSGIVNETKLSPHLESRLHVEHVLKKSTVPLTTLRAGIIIGSGGASFEIIRDLVEKLPVMIAPKWVDTKTQPIAIRNVVQFLCGVMGNSDTYSQSFDIGGPDVLTYKEMLLKFAKTRGLKRKIISIPFLTPRASSYWLYFVTGTSYSLAKNLVDSMTVKVVCRPNDLTQKLNIHLISYSEAIRLAFDKIEQHQVLSSWKDAIWSPKLFKNLSKYLEVPKHGCYFDAREQKSTNSDKSLEKIWNIGGRNGWYYANFLWKIRGLMDKLVGGVGLRRGRKNSISICPGDAIDFWRVIYADKEKKRLLLYAEMKLPGEAWLEFKIGDNNIVHQTATFRPLGVFGRLYWYSLLPFHGFIFKNMLDRIANPK